MRPFAAALFFVVAASARATCPTVTADVAPGLVDLTTTPPTWVPQGDGAVTVADVVVLLRAGVGLVQLDFAPPLAFDCPDAAGDVAPGTLDTSTTPPTWYPVGDGVVGVADAVFALNAAVALRQDPPRSLTGTWSGTPTLSIGGTPQQVPMRFQLVHSSGGVTGCAVFTDDSHPEDQHVVSGTFDGTTADLTITPEPSPADDCANYSFGMAFSLSGDTLTFEAVSGSRCEGNGGGGHVSLDPLSNPSGTLARGDLTGTWSGNASVTIDGTPQQVPLIVQFGVGCSGSSGLLYPGGDEVQRLDGTFDAGTIVAVTRAEPSSQDDCDQYPTTWTFAIGSDTLTLQSVTGTKCEGDGNGGHSSLLPITAGSGTLTTASLTGRWQGTVHLGIGGTPQDVTVSASVVQDAQRLRGSIVLGGGETNVLTGDVQGSTVTIISTAQNNPADDCDLHPITFTFTRNGSALDLVSVSGQSCNGDGAGGHSSLDPVTGGTGSLTRL